MQDVSHNHGRTVLFVSHNMAAVQKLCERGVLLENGSIKSNELIKNAIEQYINAKVTENSIFIVPKEKETDLTKGYATQIQFEDEFNNIIKEIPIGSTWQIRVFFKILSKVDYFIVGLGFKNMYDVNIRTVFSPRMDLEVGDYEIVFKEDKIIFGESKLKITLGLSSYEKNIHYAEDFANINFTTLHSSLEDKRIIRSNISTILNPMDVELLKK